MGNRGSVELRSDLDQTVTRSRHDLITANSSRITHTAENIYVRGRGLSGADKARPQAAPGRAALVKGSPTHFTQLWEAGRPQLKFKYQSVGTRFRKHRQELFGNMTSGDFCRRHLSHPYKLGRSATRQFCSSADTLSAPPSA